MSMIPSLFLPDDLLDAAGGDDTLVSELLAIYLRIVPPMNARLRAALHKGSPAAAAEEAHSMRSCLAVVGARALQERFKDLENAARRGSMPSDDAGSRLCNDVDALTAQVYDYQASRAALPEA